MNNSAPPIKNPIGFRRYDDQVSEKGTETAKKSYFAPVSEFSIPEKQDLLERYPSLHHSSSPSGFSVADLEGFLRKYENVVKCLEEGLSNKQVAKRCKVSETTVHNVKRVLRNLGNAKIRLK
jgi:DNA-binding NarL/FixJ family response regulator